MPSFIKTIVKYPEQRLIASNSGEHIEIGYLVKSVIPVRIGIPVNNLWEHVFITGSTGSGKTCTVARIINGVIERDYPFKVFVFDWHGEYTGLLKNYIYVDPYEYRVDLNIEETYWFIDLLYDVLELTPSQAYVLEKVFRKKRIGDLVELVNAIESFDDEAGWMRESRLALLRKLSPLIRSGYIDLFTNGSEWFNTVDKGVFIVDVSRITSYVVRRIYTAILLKKVFSQAIANGLENNVILVIEEAQNLLDRERPVKIVSSMLAEVRKFGIGLIIVSQSPSRLLEDVMINTNTKIIHSIKSSIDLEIVNKVLYLPMEYQKIIPYLDVGEAILYTRGFKKPVIIRIDSC